MGNCEARQCTVPLSQPSTGESHGVGPAMALAPDPVVAIKTEPKSSEIMVALLLRFGRKGKQEQRQASGPASDAGPPPIRVTAPKNGGSEQQQQQREPETQQRTLPRPPPN